LKYLARIGGDGGAGGVSRISNRQQAIARRTREAPEIPSGYQYRNIKMAVPEGFEPSIRLYNRITV
jgi:hypothetical protein